MPAQAPQESKLIDQSLDDLSCVNTALAVFIIVVIVIVRTGTKGRQASRSLHGVVSKLTKQMVEAIFR